MDVPINYNHHVSPNLKMLLCMTIVSSCMVKSTDIKSGFSCLYFTKYFSIVGRPSAGIMLVYIAVALAVKNLAFGGNVGRTLSWRRMSKEFLIYAGK